MSIEEMVRSYSDLYKDVYGRRPPFEHLKEVNSMSDAEFEQQFKKLVNMLEED